jgi:hypothetical protein
MKVIDLLNKIANGEEVPEKIKYKDIIFDYKKEKGDYESEEGQFFLDWVELNEYGLHDEVEIIEEDKKIEKITMRAGLVGDIDNKLENLDINIMAVEDKINEIIDYINRSDK